MTTKKIIEGITDWVQEAICGKIELKVPDDNANDDGYNIKRVHPAASRCTYRQKTGYHPASLRRSLRSRCK